MHLSTNRKCVGFATAVKLAKAGKPETTKDIKTL